MSTDDLTPRAETPEETMERLRWDRVWSTLRATLSLTGLRGPDLDMGATVVHALRVATINEINEQVGGGDLASLAERLGALEEKVAEVESWFAGDPDHPGPPQTPAERRTGEKLLEVVRGTGTADIAVVRAALPDPAFVGTVAGELHRVVEQARVYRGEVSNHGDAPVAVSWLSDLMATCRVAVAMLDRRTVPPAAPVTSGEREELAVWLESQAKEHDWQAESASQFTVAEKWHDVAAEKHRRAATLLRALPSECGDEYQGSTCRLPKGHAGPHEDPDTDSEEGRGAVWVDESVVDTREPGAPIVEAGLQRDLDDRVAEEDAALLREDDGERFEGYVSPATVSLLRSGHGAAFSRTVVGAYNLPATLILRAPQPREELRPPTGEER